jgi:hypothetical protein
MPSIRNHGDKGNDRDSENACGDLQPRLARARAPIRFDRHYWNYGLYRWFQLTDEPIPPPRQRLDKARALGRITQHLANLVNGCIQVVIDVDKRVRPEPLLQFLPRHHVARTLQQNAEHLKRLPPELLLHSGLAQFAGAKINLEILKSQESKLVLYVCHR